MAEVSLPIAAIPVDEGGAFEFEITMRSFYGDFEVYVEGNLAAGSWRW